MRAMSFMRSGSFRFCCLLLACTVYTSCVSNVAEEKEKVLDELLPEEPAKLAQPIAPSSPAQSTQLDLPLPRGVAHADLLHFMNSHSTLMLAYMPLLNEWQVFSQLFSDSGRIGSDDFLLYRARVRNNPARTHWLFVWGIHQTSHALLAGKRSESLLIDRQKDFILRMRTLVYLMSELELAGMKAEYRSFLRQFYKGVSVKYFKRSLKDRPVKPRGLIEPK